ncbi:YALIA101S11e02850g1_1 [Yarrowia lipolytica]|uniref:Uncharacterized protein n=1 Tax=Yarrowia lipolytica TaxID=4952 RepID=A0A1D8NEQ9_YARLL|nr:hypothetical protein YALI1_D19562g [Yarrowia lipolytica]SEI36392.1 YALIA101S11e02850g1_1 [Yarrowia lipolytica]VBB88132.1 Hypothetical protein conserved in the Yarrowia clade [Yarrowia lipolytica]
MERQKELETEILVELAKINETAILINENVLACTELLNRNHEGINFSHSTDALCSTIERFIQDVDGEQAES